MSGALDFRQADITDPAWWRRFKTTIDEVGRQGDKDILTGYLRFYAAFVPLLPGMEKSGRDSAVASFVDVIRWLEYAVSPWRGTPTARKIETLESAAAAYKAEFGDPSDPEVQKKLLAMLDAIAEEKKKLAVESPEDRINRLSAEREQKRNAVLAASARRRSRVR